MTIEADLLFKEVSARAQWFDEQAYQHKMLNRFLWGVTTALSMSVAMLANVDFSLAGVTTADITGILAIILPAVTGYSVLRSPERLWILEIDMRNKLLDLQQRLVFEAQRNQAFDRMPFEREYFALLQQANSRWREIKEGQRCV